MSDDLVVRASDAEREQVVVVLREAAAEGRLTLEELSERVDEAYQARTKAELERVTRELPVTVPPRKRPHRFTISIFGGVDRKGRWRVPRRSFVLGGNDVHGSEGRIAQGAPLVRIVALSLFGGLDLWHVPAGASGSRKELRRAARRREREG